MTDWSVYDQPALRDSVSSPAPGGRREVLLGIDGMHCAACVGRIERLLAGRASDVGASLTSRTLQFRFDPRREPLSTLLRTLEDAGFVPQVLAQDAGLRAQREERRAMLARIGVAVICAMQVMMLAWPTYTFGGAAAEIDPGIEQLLRWAQALFATPCVLYAGSPFFRSAWRALRARSVNMDVTVAASVAIAYGASLIRTVLGEGEIYYDTATMFVMLLLIGRFVEGRTRMQAGERLRLLAGRRRLTAQRETPQGIEAVPLSAVAPGDTLVVAPGESVPVDGTLLDAAAEMDEALLTGESRAVLHRAGDRLLAGCLNLGQQALRLRAQSVGAATRLAQITQLLQQAQAARPRFQLLADRLAGAFIVTVLLLALAGAALWWPDVDRSLSVLLAVLVASCPCALSLAIPAAMAAAASRLAALGVLSARPEALARLPLVDTVLFDKTGTLTRAELRIVRVEPQAELDEAGCLAIAAALERGLMHPIARAFAQTPSRFTATQQQQIPGRGVEGVVDGRRYRLGAPAVSGDDATADVDTVIELRDERRALARIRLATVVREDAAGTIAAMREAGMNVELLTGDGEAAAEALARRLGLQQVLARQTPEQKLARLEALQRQGRVVLAVGDGINDAPFLAAADVSAAMPLGAALAQARADLLLVGDSLAALIPARDIARQAQRRVRQNVAWALAYNLGVLPLAMAGVLAPWMAALGMSLSSLLVVANALRLRRTRPVQQRPLNYAEVH
ncbi:cation-translocating P-type ATPase [Fontimonas sp. SYSU GA230001]|uniref:heavy metal translocating P-type ATPase n=1 Tax=Fontimonas sp. SYSU GA230001 TaxID=3142450 RepID=UPI0032B386D6